MKIKGGKKSIYSFVSLGKVASASRSASWSEQRQKKLEKKKNRGKGRENHALTFGLRRENGKTRERDMSCY